MDFVVAISMQQANFKKKDDKPENKIVGSRNGKSAELKKAREHSGWEEIWLPIIIHYYFPPATSKINVCSCGK